MPQNENYPTLNTDVTLSENEYLNSQSLNTIFFQFIENDKTLYDMITGGSTPIPPGPTPPVPENLETIKIDIKNLKTSTGNICIRLKNLTEIVNNYDIKNFQKDTSKNIEALSKEINSITTTLNNISAWATQDQILSLLSYLGQIQTFIVTFNQILKPMYDSQFKTLENNVVSIVNDILDINSALSNLENMLSGIQFTINNNLPRFNKLNPPQEGAYFCNVSKNNNNNVSLEWKKVENDLMNEDCIFTDESVMLFFVDPSQTNQIVNGSSWKYAFPSLQYCLNFIYSLPQGVLEQTNKIQVFLKAGIHNLDILEILPISKETSLNANTVIKLEIIGGCDGLSHQSYQYSNTNSTIYFNKSFSNRQVIINGEKQIQNNIFQNIGNDVSFRNISFRNLGQFNVFPQIEVKDVLSKADITNDGVIYRLKDLLLNTQSYWMFSQSKYLDRNKNNTFQEYFAFSSLPKIGISSFNSNTVFYTTTHTNKYQRWNGTSWDNLAPIIEEYLYFIDFPILPTDVSKYFVDLSTNAIYTFNNGYEQVTSLNVFDTDLILNPINGPIYTSSQPTVSVFKWGFDAGYGQYSKLSNSEFNYYYTQDDLPAVGALDRLYLVESNGVLTGYQYILENIFQVSEIYSMNFSSVVISSSVDKILFDKCEFNNSIISTENVSIPNKSTASVISDRSKQCILRKTNFIENKIHSNISGLSASIMFKEVGKLYLESCKLSNNVIAEKINANGYASLISSINSGRVNIFNCIFQWNRLNDLFDFKSSIYLFNSEVDLISNNLIFGNSFSLTNPDNSFFILTEDTQFKRTDINNFSIFNNLISNNDTEMLNYKFVKDKHDESIEYDQNNEIYFMFGFNLTSKEIIPDMFTNVLFQRELNELGSELPGNKSGLLKENYSSINLIPFKESEVFGGILISNHGPITDNSIQLGDDLIDWEVDFLGVSRNSLVNSDTNNSHIIVKGPFLI